MDRIAFGVQERHERQGVVGLAGARVSIDVEDIPLAAEDRFQFRRYRSQLSRRLVILNHLPRRPPAAPEYMNKDHLKACSNLVVTPPRARRVVCGRNEHDRMNALKSTRFIGTYKPGIDSE